MSRPTLAEVRRKLAEAGPNVVEAARVICQVDPQRPNGMGHLILDLIMRGITVREIEKTFEIINAGSGHKPLNPKGAN